MTSKALARPCVVFSKQILKQHVSLPYELSSTRAKTFFFYSSPPPPLSKKKYAYGGNLRSRGHFFYSTNFGKNGRKISPLGKGRFAFRRFAAARHSELRSEKKLEKKKEKKRLDLSSDLYTRNPRTPRGTGGVPSLGSLQSADGF